MPDYKKMYFMLFNAITDALMWIRNSNLREAASVLMAAQRQGEEMYSNGEEWED